jgi:hypothetical protein
MNKLLLTLMLIFVLFTNYSVAEETTYEKVMKEKHEEMKDKERERILHIELFCAKESGQATNDFAAKKIYESCLAANK